MEKLSAYIHKKAWEIFKNLKEMEKHIPGSMQQYIDGDFTHEWAMTDIEKDVKSGKVELPKSGKYFKMFEEQYNKRRYNDIKVTEHDVWFLIVDDLIGDKVANFCKNFLATGRE